MNWLGIDVGLSGAVAVLHPEGVSVYDTPTLTVGTKRDYSLHAMSELLAVYAGKACAALEHVHAFPEQGSVSGFNFGRGFGLWEGLLTAYEISYEHVSPQRWKKEFGLIGKVKDEARMVASRIYPQVDLSLKRHHGRADAVLLAEYYRRKRGNA